MADFTRRGKREMAIFGNAAARHCSDRLYL